jgi:hypothetical protein
MKNKNNEVKLRSLLEGLSEEGVTTYQISVYNPFMSKSSISPLPI